MSDKAFEMMGTSGVYTVPGIAKDPEYDWVAPLPPAPTGILLGKRGRQCGACGIKFEYNHTYGFRCGNNRCPCGWN